MPNTVSATCEIEVNETRIAFHLPDSEDHIQKHILRSRTFYEQRMLEDIAPLIPDGALAIDAGANIGNHTLFFSKVLGASVLAFEPNPQALAVLSANIELNGLKQRVELHAVALGETAGSGRIVDTNSSNLGMAQVTQDSGGDIEIVSLDEVVGDRLVSLIKIDVEGMECEVLKGATETLKRSKPALIIEAATVGALREIEAILRPFGYRKIKVYNHTPTYLFKMVDPVAYAGERALDLIAPEALAALPPTTGIYAGMATVAGNEIAMRAAVNSLLPQIDRMFLYLNGFKEAPEFVRSHPKITYFIDEDGKQYGDAGKFWGLEQVSDALYITCDDDIIYPDDFVERMIAELASTGGRSVVSVHGSIILQPATTYYAEGNRAVFHFQQGLLRRRLVHVPASGTSMFHSSVITMKLSDFRHPNMADIWLCEFLQRNRIPGYVVPRRQNWLAAIDVKRPTIYDQSRQSSGSAYDSSRRQDEVLSGLYPLTLLHTKQNPSAVLLDADRTVDIPTLLSGLALDDRDPVIFVVCETVTDAVRRTIIGKGTRKEIHLLSRTAPLSALYRQLLTEASPYIKTWKIHAGMRPERITILDWPQWLDDHFPASLETA